MQLRAPGVATGTLVDWTRGIVAAAAGRGARIVVNDRCDVALMAGADGVHVGQDDLPAGVVRELLGPDAVVGLSTHDAPQLEAALSEPISYLAVGPVYATRTKDTGYAAVGLEAVRRAAHAAGGRPVAAIGGITLETAPAVIAAGAALGRGHLRPARGRRPGGAGAGVSGGPRPYRLSRAPRGNRRPRSRYDRPSFPRPPRSHGFRSK